MNKKTVVFSDLCASMYRRFFLTGLNTNASITPGAGTKRNVRNQVGCFAGFLGRLFQWTFGFGISGPVIPAGFAFVSFFTEGQGNPSFLSRFYCPIWTIDHDKKISLEKISR